MRFRHVLLVVVTCITLAVAQVPASRPNTSFKITLRNGVSVELLGVVKGHVIKEWWLPDGTPDAHPLLAAVRFEPATQVLSAQAADGDGGQSNLGLVFRLHM